MVKKAAEISEVELAYSLAREDLAIFQSLVSRTDDGKAAMPPRHLLDQVIPAPFNPGRIWRCTLCHAGSYPVGHAPGVFPHLPGFYLVILRAQVALVFDFPRHGAPDAFLE